MTAEQASYWKLLVTRLKTATSKHGAKAQLAREFGVSKQVVHAWLTGEGTPGAENTLRLLEWVTAKEAQQKSLGDAPTSPRPKTRKPKQKHSNESSKQSDQS
jgi:hypothetical protein